MGFFRFDSFSNFFSSLKLLSLIAVTIAFALMGSVFKRLNGASSEKEKIIV